MSMRFLVLTHPRYRTDREERARNPVTSTATHRLPGIDCEACGPWASSERLRVAMPPDAGAFAGVRFLPVDAWRRATPGWTAALGVRAEELAPGAEIGPPRGSCSSPIREDAVHPMPGEIWIASRVKDALAAASLTGVAFAAVALEGACGETSLWEIVVRGRARRTGSTDERLRACGTCGRRAFRDPKVLAVDEATWDGADFVFLDHNPNIVVVTERVEAVLSRGAFSNLVAEPIS